MIEHAQAGAAAQKEGHFDVAIKEFREVTKLLPNAAAGHANLGDAYFQNGEYEAAIPELEEALRLNPQLLGTHQTLGVALLVEGNAAAALPHLEETHTPELLGLAYLETGRFGMAILALHAALERQPNDPDFLYYYGKATAAAANKAARQLEATTPHFAEGQGKRPVREVATLEAELAKTPDDPQLLYDFQRAATLDSTKAFDQILQSNADSARAHQVLAERAVAQKQLADAEREYAQALKIKPYTPGLHLALGDVYAAQGNWPVAIEQFRMEAKLQPQNISTLYRLGAALMQQGQAGEALLAFSAADKLHPNTPPILLALGSAAQAANDTAGAEKYWAKLLTLDQQSNLAAQAHLALSGLYKNEGRTSQAADEMAAYQKLKTQGKP